MNKLILVAIAILMFSCAEKKQNDKPENVKPESTIDSDGILKHMNILSSDEFEGRFPASVGEEKTIEYVSNEFQKMGIEPANNGSYIQSFDITEMSSQPDEKIVINAQNKVIQLNWKDEFVAQTRRLTDKISTGDAELVFCGYGITAPEYNWNDFGDMDMSDKIAVVFVNDPGFATQDPKLFTGNDMTYYGRWSYKYEEAERQGCLGLMIIHEDDAAGYSWEVVRNGWSGTEMVIVDDKQNMGKAAVEGWFNKTKATEIFEAAGYSFEMMKEMSLKPDFKSISLNARVSIDIEVESTPTKTNNIVGLIKGSKRPDEYLIYMGHWDHYGIGEAVNGDSIYNGARDNASGVAGILEVAESFTKLENKPERSILFMFTGGEEQGLLGSKFYGANPLFPINKTVACINIDGLNIWGEMNDIVQIGKGQSPDLDELMSTYFGEMGMTVNKDPEGEKGYFYRSDHFSLAKNGVPAIYTHMGFDHKENGAEWGEKQVKAWTKEVYHKPADEVTPDWDLSGAVVELNALYYLGHDLANSDNWPKWSDKSEFKAIREESMGK